MDKFDIINALFEAFGAYTAWKNFASLYRDREIKGVYWPVWGFFTAWGLWNVFYYPALDQWFSFAAGVVLLAGNASWTVLAARLMMFADYEPELGIEPLKPLAAVWNSAKKQYEYRECLTPLQLEISDSTADTQPYIRRADGLRPVQDPDGVLWLEANREEGGKQRAVIGTTRLFPGLDHPDLYGTTENNS